MCFGMISQTGAVRNDSGYINVADRAAAFYRGGDLAFTDVAGDAWYADAVRWAAANGMVAGVGGNRIAPAASATRAEGAVVLMKYMQTKN